MDRNLSLHATCHISSTASLSIFFLPISDAALSKVGRTLSTRACHRSWDDRSEEVGWFQERNLVWNTVIKLLHIRYIMYKPHKIMNENTSTVEETNSEASGCFFCRQVLRMTSLQRNTCINVMLGT